MEDDHDLPELFNFTFIVQGEEKQLKEIKAYLQECVEKGLITLSNPTYDEREIYIVTNDQWKEYQKLRNRDEGLIGYWVG